MSITIQNQYSEETVKFISRWNLTPEENDKNLEKVESGKLTPIWVGCDTGRRRHYDFCKKNHGDKYKDTSLNCRVCERGLDECELTSVYIFENRKIVHHVENTEMIQEIEKMQISMDAKITQKKAKNEETTQAMQKYKNAKKQFFSFQNATNNDARAKELIPYWEGEMKKYERVVLELAGYEKGKGMICKNCGSLTDMPTYDGCYGCSTGE